MFIEAISAFHIFSPKGWDNIAQGNALGTTIE
jgi:hypothetical protein